MAAAAEPVDIRSVGQARRYLDALEAALFSDLDAAQLNRCLQPTSLDNFLNLLSFNANNAASRAVVESGTVPTSEGLITLDRDPDITEITKLADAAKLDELAALALVLAAQEQSGAVSAAAAAGILYEERLAAVQSLLCLLHAQVASGGDLPADIYSTVASFNSALLQREEGGATVLVKRLVELIRSASVPPPPDSPLPTVGGVYGGELERGVVMQRECTALCECLVYSCCIKQRATPADIEALLDLLHHLALHARTPSARQLAAQHQANLVLLAVLLTMLPLEHTQGPEMAEDERAMRLLANAAGVDAKVRARVPADDPYSSTVRLAWGLLPLWCMDEPLIARGVEDVKIALSAGALGFLGDGLIGSLTMADEAEDLRLTAASVVHQLLTLVLEVANEGMDDLKKRSLDGRPAEIDAGGHSEPHALMAIDSRGAGGHQAPAPHPDTLATLLHCMAVALAVRPGLFMDEERRAPQVGNLMSEVGNDAAGLADVPSVLLAYVEVMSALATGEGGARMIFAQLRGENAPPLVSWRRMFSTLYNVIAIYNPSSGHENGGQAGQRRTSDFVLPSNDTRALCAFSKLFERVMSEGTPEEVASWVRQLDDDAGVSPCWEVLFQVMCCPVPQTLKAALDAAIASLARRADLAVALWDRLMAAVVVQPYGAGALEASGAGVPRYDLIYQLNEIESRSDDYVEALAFVQLLNALWEAGGRQEDGRSVSHFTKFVRDEILGTAFQRTFKDEAQRWALVAAGLDHCRLCLEALPLGPAAMTAELATPATSRPPGLDVLLDLLGEKNVARAALTTLSMGVDGLEAERHSSDSGAAKEDAVLAALRLLHAGFSRDADFVAAAQRAQHHASYATLEAVLRHDRSRIPVLLEYMRYPFSARVQEEALRLTTAIAQRTPHLVQLLLTSPPNGATAADIVRHLQESFAACLHAAVTAQVAPTQAQGDGVEVESTEDQRASMALDLLLSCLEAPTPNLTQMLCGFDITGGTSPMALWPLRSAHTPLRVILEVLGNVRNATARPHVFEQCLEVVYELAAATDTGPATLDSLRGYCRALVPLLGDVGCAALPQQSVGPVRAASLHQRAWLLQIFALELHHADPALATQRESLQELLTALFGAAKNGNAAAMGPSRGKIVDVLALAVGEVPAEPQLGAGASVEVRRMAQALDIETLLASPTGPGEGGVRATGVRGDPAYDVLALKDELLTRYNDWVALHGAPGEALKDAGRAALKYAADFNAYAEEMGGRSALLAAWHAVAAVAFSRRFDVLAAQCGGSTRATELVLSTCEDALEAAMVLLQGPGAGLVPPLCGALEALFSRLQEQAISAATADPIAGLPLPSRCHALLGTLLEVAWECRGQDAARLVLYDALVSYLAMCRGPTLLQAPPAIVSALLEGLPRSSGGGGAVQLDALQLRLEEGNVAQLHNNIRMLQVLAADALSPNPAMATAALTALAGIAAADPTTVAADEIHASALPARLLQDLQDQPAAALAQPPPAGQAAMVVAEAKLALLLRLALAGPPTARAAAAQKLFSLQALPRLAACPSLDIQPEEPGFGAAGGGGASLRRRLHHIVTPALRLALGLVTALPHSAAVRDQTATFVESHARAFARILRESASPGVQGWEPADADLEEATLVTQLLTELVPHRRLAPQVAPALQEAAYRAASRFLAANSKSQSPPVVRVHAAREAGTAGAADHRTYAKILALRCALACYLRALAAASDTPALLPCAPSVESGSGGVPTLFLIRDALVQAAVYDLPDAVAESQTLASVLRSGDPHALEDAAGVRRLVPAATPRIDGAAARAAVMSAASARQTEVTRLGLLVEYLLAIMFQQLRAAVEVRGETSPALAALRPSNAAKTPQAGLASAKDLDQLRRMTEPAIAALERMLAERALPGDAASFELLIRRTKECLAAL